MHEASFLFPAALHHTSYLRMKEFCDKIKNELKKSGVPYCADPGRYALADELYDGTPYHLNLVGRQLRTKLLVEDLGRFMDDMK